MTGREGDRERQKRQRQRQRQRKADRYTDKHVEREGRTGRVELSRLKITHFPMLLLPAPAFKKYDFPVKAERHPGTYTAQCARNTSCHPLGICSVPADCFAACGCHVGARFASPSYAPRGRRYKTGTTDTSTTKKRTESTNACLPSAVDTSTAMP